MSALSIWHITRILNHPVASLFKMFTYFLVCSAFSSARALCLNEIRIFEMACKLKSSNHIEMTRNLLLVNIKFE